MILRDEECLLKAHAVLEVDVGRESVLYAVGGGEDLDDFPFEGFLNGFDLDVVADLQGTFWKLHEQVRALGMNEVATLFFKSDFLHGLLEVLHKEIRQDEVEVTGFVSSFGVDRYDGAAHEDGVDASGLQVGCDVFPELFFRAGFKINLHVSLY